MAGQQQQEKKVGFKSVQLLKEQTLGIGSYGKVCRAKCDNLLCAAKLIHETLCDPIAQQLIAPQREHRLPMKRFKQECEFLSTVRHPNIVQYLGIYQDPDTGLPALLMELMDDSLTHFLESSPRPIPYHIQVNICHDITLALSFLHSNGIVHRDLSSNNVLLIGNVRAKVTDFGMARLGDQNQQATKFTSTMCPGTGVYMPPEAIKDNPVYTEKIDCFSFGVIAVQIIIRQFPKPGDRQVTLNDPHYPQGTVKLCVPEIERRQNHISIINPNHPLKPVALQCLKDKDVERPSAQQLCERVAALKGAPKYSESVRVVEARSTAEWDRSEERDRELISLRKQHSLQVQGLQQIIKSQVSRLAEKDETIARKEQAITQNAESMSLQAQYLGEKEKELTEKVDMIDRLERQLENVNHQLEESEQVIAQFQRRIAELEQLKPATDVSSSSKEQITSIKLTWREGEKALYKTSGSYRAAVDGNTLYVVVGCPAFYYTVSTSSWSRLPDSPSFDSSSVIINNLLTVVGGHMYGTSVVTNKLFSLTGEGSGREWTEKFPPMPTKRYWTIALCTEAALIVAGGWDDKSALLGLQIVEVMNTETVQWSTAAELPQPLWFAPASVCGDQIYILGGSNMYTCSLQALLQSCKLFLASFRNRGVKVWKKVAAPPVTNTTCVSIRDRQVAIGGRDLDLKPTTAIHMYNPTTDSWEVISHMGTPRRDCIAAVLPNNQLMVVGGYTNGEIKIDSVELASVE